MSKREHWEAVYETKASDAVSWYQHSAARSHALILAAAPDRASRIIDVGGGASVLVDELMVSGYRNVTVLDIARSSLDAASRRLGIGGRSVRWLRGDVCELELNPAVYDIWHDRAVFHFLTDAADRAAYLRRLRLALAHGGHAVIATFAEDGPEMCSGLPVVRYTPETLHAQLGADFEMIVSERESHRTPWGSEQSFVFCTFRMKHDSRSRDKDQD